MLFVVVLVQVFWEQVQYYCYLWVGVIVCYFIGLVVGQFDGLVFGCWLWVQYFQQWQVDVVDQFGVMFGGLQQVCDQCGGGVFVFGVGYVYGVVYDVIVSCVFCKLQCGVVDEGGVLFCCCQCDWLVRVDVG